MSETLNAGEGRGTSVLAFDPAHDLAHIERVVATACRLARAEGAHLAVVEPAAWLHDLVNVPKNDPRRSSASRLSAEAATQWLRDQGYDERWLPGIAHAIEAHSFSSGIACRTIEARVVQDADRLDALGAIGLARLFTVGGLLRRPLYASNDPFCQTREPDDATFTLDHIYRKLLVIASTLQTHAGREEGARRRVFIEQFIGELSREGV